MSDIDSIEVCNNIYILNHLSCARKGILAKFSAVGTEFEVKVLDIWILDPDHELDNNDRDALNKGYTEINMLAAVSVEDQLPYAIWEFYSTNQGSPYLGKHIFVDKNHQRRGIGKNFCLAVKGAGFDIVPSGTQTSIGAKLLNSIEK